jgi:hypothetical protein
VTKAAQPSRCCSTKSTSTSISRRGVLSMTGHEGEPPLRPLTEGSPADWHPRPLRADWEAREDTNTALGHCTLPPSPPWAGRDGEGRSGGQGWRRGLSPAQLCPPASTPVRGALIAFMAATSQAAATKAAQPSAAARLRAPARCFGGNLPSFIVWSTRRVPIAAPFRQIKIEQAISYKQSLHSFRDGLCYIIENSPASEHVHPCSR